MVAALRYLDTFVKTDGAWLFVERLFYVDWGGRARAVLTAVDGKVTTPRRRA